MAANQNGGIHIEGLRQTIKSLQQYGVEISDLKDVFSKVGNIIVNQGQINAPKKTGALARSIKASKTKNKSIVRAGSARVPYAGVIHYGGYHGIEPHPFLTKAVAQHHDDIMKTFSDGLRALAQKLDLEH